MGRLDGPHTSELRCLGGSSLWHSPGTLCRGPCHHQVSLFSDTFSACQHENLFSQVLVRGWLAAPPGPPPVLPLFRQVSRLLTIPTIAPYHLSDVVSWQRTGGLGLHLVPCQGPFAGPGGLFPSRSAQEGPAWFLGDLGPRETLLSGTGSFKVISCFLVRKNWFLFVCLFCIPQPEFIVEAEKNYRVHWKKEARRSAGDLVRQQA